MSDGQHRKLAYTPPRAIKLSPGSSAYADACLRGSTATDTCGAGISVTGQCFSYGSTATVDCFGYGNAATTACENGNNRTGDCAVAGIGL